MSGETTPGVDIVTFGCRLNAYESEVIRARAAEDGLTDAIVFNTCAVTNEAVRQARQAIRKARRERPGARVIVTGCAAQIDPAAFAAMAEVDLILGNAEKSAAGAYLDRPAEGRVRVNDIMSVRETAGHLIDGLKDRARAYVEVQNGCDHRCTFCIIPFGRGNSRSVPAGVVVNQIKRLVEKGYAEIVLTGVDMTSWGADLPATPRLGDLILRILKLVPDLPRLRISSIDSIEVDPALMRAIATEGRLMPHLHLSLQHGDDLILKRMKRRHLRDDAIRFTEEAMRLRPEMTFGADIIAGFPTETEAHFKSSLALVKDCNLTWLHVFPYSVRNGTPAARMPQVNGRDIKSRAARLRAAGEEQVALHLRAQIGKDHNVLMEKPNMGRTQQFAEVLFTKPQPEGKIIVTEITSASATQLQGRAK